MLCGESCLQYSIKVVFPRAGVAGTSFGGGPTNVNTSCANASVVLRHGVVRERSRVSAIAMAPEVYEVIVVGACTNGYAAV